MVPGQVVKGARFALIDALRGIAAMGVVLYHIYLRDLVPRTSTRLIEPFHSLVSYGYLGVYVFFVLSGFVIAHVVGTTRITPRFVARFALRRSIRLDPPYWVAMAAAIVVAAFAGDDSTPSAGAVAAHVAYAQDFVGVPHLNAVFWTLCLEVQFYLAYVLTMLAAQRVARDRVWWVFGPLWIVSLLATTHVLHAGFALFVWAWPYFFLGAITAWHFGGRISTPTWAVVTVVSCAAIACADGRWETGDAAPRLAVVVATTIGLFAAGRARLLEATLGRPLQYLGRISYSLYLTHAHAAIVAMHAGLYYTGTIGGVELVALLVGCAALTIPVAHVMHVVVERPAHRLAQRVDL